MQHTFEEWKQIIRDINHPFCGVGPFDVHKEERELIRVLLQHMIGLDYRNPRRDAHGMLRYTPYRNYYDAPANEFPLWDALVECGLCKKTSGDDDGAMYSLTILGQRSPWMFSEGEFITVYNPDSLYEAETRRAIIRFLVEADAAGDPVQSSPTIANELNFPISRVYDYVIRLKEEGFLIKRSARKKSLDGIPYVTNGYCVTEYAKKTDPVASLYNRLSPKDCAAETAKAE